MSISQLAKNGTQTTLSVYSWKWRMEEMDLFLSYKWHQQQTLNIGMGKSVHFPPETIEKTFFFHLKASHPPDFLLLSIPNFERKWCILVCLPSVVSLLFSGWLSACPIGQVFNFSSEERTTRCFSPRIFFPFCCFEKNRNILAISQSSRRYTKANRVQYDTRKKASWFLLIFSQESSFFECRRSYLSKAGQSIYCSSTSFAYDGKVF